MHEIKALKAKLYAIGPFHPGKITQQWVRCGKKNCKCKDAQSPQKHGPYYLLSYAAGKKNSTIFLKENELEEAKAWLEEFQNFKSLTHALTEAYIHLAKQKRWHRDATQGL